MKNLLLLSLLLLVAISLQEAKGKSRVRRVAVIKSQRRRWPQNTITYKFNTKRSGVVYAFQKIFEELEKMTCLKFKPLPPGSSGYHLLIKFQSKGCSSKVGYQGTSGGTRKFQALHISPGCLWFGRLRHELAHSIGLYHQMQSPNRDNYVNIHKSNIQQGRYVRNFKKLRKSSIKEFGQKQYDYGSVMQYGAYAFAKNSKIPTITAKDPKNNKYFTKFNNIDYSFYDLYAINKAYKCNTKCSGSCPELTGFYNSQCQCVKASDPMFAVWPPKENAQQSMNLAKEVQEGKEKVRDVTKKWTKDTSAVTVYKVHKKPAFLLVIKSVDNIPDDLFLADMHLNSDGWKNALRRGFRPPYLDKYFRTWVITVDKNFKVGSK